ncbi:MAG: nucleotidyltransferase domain-containing protein [Patescibacteria group bacterium]|jgi:hypothetical protein
MGKEEIKKKIKEAVLKSDYRKDIEKISLFGSYLSGAEKKDSDVDLLVEFNPAAIVGYFKLVAIQKELGEAVKKEVDLLTPGALSKYFRDEVMKQAELIYEK